MISRVSAAHSSTDLKQAYTSACGALPPEIAAELRTSREMSSKVSKRKKKQMPGMPVLLQDVEIPEAFARLSYANVVEGGPVNQSSFSKRNLLFREGMAALRQS